MHTTTTGSTTTGSTATPTIMKPQRVLRTGVVAAVTAAIATTTVAIIAKAVHVPVAIENKPIPVAGFAQLTFICALIGTAIAATLARKKDRARTLFMRTTITLTILSILPDLTVTTDTATRVTLIATHAIAASIVIPAIARRLANTN
jgi:Family of unknown function (DUF6069)